MPYWVTRIELFSIFTKTSQNCVSRCKNVFNSKHLFCKRMRTGNKLHTDRHRAAARWLPTTAQDHCFVFVLKMRGGSSRVRDIAGRHYPSDLDGSGFRQKLQKLGPRTILLRGPHQHNAALLLPVAQNIHCIL